MLRRWYDINVCVCSHVCMLIIMCVCTCLLRIIAANSVADLSSIGSMLSTFTIDETFAPSAILNHAREHAHAQHHIWIKHTKHKWCNQTFQWHEHFITHFNTVFSGRVFTVVDAIECNTIPAHTQCSRSLQRECRQSETFTVAQRTATNERRWVKSRHTVSLRCKPTLVAMSRFDVSINNYHRLYEIRNASSIEWLKWSILCSIVTFIYIHQSIELRQH